MLPHVLKPLLLALIAQEQSHGARYASTIYLKLFKNSHRGQTHKDSTILREVRQAM